MSAVTSASLLRHRPFLLYLWSRSFSRLSSQIAAVAVGWQVYAMTGSAFQLGMVGLVQFLPTAILVFTAGHAVDRFDRKRVQQLCQIAEGLTGAFLAWGSFAGWLTVPQIFIAMAVFGTITAFENPAGAAMLPSVVPEGTLQRATAVSSGVAQIAMITGPALGGFAYAISPGTPYAMMTGFWIVGAFFTGLIELERRPSLIFLPAWVSCATILRSSARSRLICSLFFSAARRRCCLSTHATFSTPVHSDLVYCVPRRLSAP
jgi:MFS family permease